MVTDLFETDENTTSETVIDLWIKSFSQRQYSLYAKYSKEDLLNKLICLKYFGAPLVIFTTYFSKVYFKFYF